MRQDSESVKEMSCCSTTDDEIDGGLFRLDLGYGLMDLGRMNGDGLGENERIWNPSFEATSTIFPQSMPLLGTKKKRGLPPLH